LKIIAPKAGNTVGNILQIVETALPIVENIAESQQIASNDAKWEQARRDTRAAIPVAARENVLESGVQLAYSIFKAAKA
jgi:hypothetical protein